MQYVNKTFTVPVTSKRMSQTEYEIAVGLRHPDGSLVQVCQEVRKRLVPSPGRVESGKTVGRTGSKYGTLAPFSVDLQDVAVAPKGVGAGIVYHFKKPKKESNG